MNEYNGWIRMNNWILRANMKEKTNIKGELDWINIKGEYEWINIKGEYE